MKQNEYIVTYTNGSADRIRTECDLFLGIKTAGINARYIEADIIESQFGHDVYTASIIVLNNVCKIEEIKDAE